MAGGRPLKFQTPEELDARIKEYYAWAEANDKPLTIERLACFLDVDRDTILNYTNREEFFPTISKARSFILADKLERGLAGKANAAFGIFDLKNNHGFADTQYLNHGGQNGNNPINQSIQIELIKPDENPAS